MFPFGIAVSCVSVVTTERKYPHPKTLHLSGFFNGEKFLLYLHTSSQLSHLVNITYYFAPPISGAGERSTEWRENQNGIPYHWNGFSCALMYQSPVVF